MWQFYSGEYKPIELLNKNKMSSVYLVENTFTGSLFVLKKIYKYTEASSVLSVEADILKKLSHPSLPCIYDIAEDSDGYYLVMDYIDGLPLSKVLNLTDKISNSTAINWAKQIVSALIYLHSIKPYPIIHSDLKPSNIILTSENKIKLIDFGISREYKSDTTQSDICMGTKGYAAPEQYLSSKIDARADIYSFGVTLDRITTDKSKQLSKVIAKCTMQNPSERYQTAKKLLSDLSKR